MQKTLIVSALTGCGKTWLAEHQDQYGYQVCDYDSQSCEKTDGWEVGYVAGVLEEVKSGRYDFVLICQTEAVLNEMDKQLGDFLLENKYAKNLLL